MLPNWLRSLRPRSKNLLSTSGLVRPRGYGLMLERLEDRWVPSTFTVTNTNDDGNLGSFRSALLQANNNPGPDTINFNIPGGGVQTINVVSTALPTITDQVTIDATTQPGYAGVPLIVLNGANAGSTTTALTITASASTVKGLDISQFGGDGIDLIGSNNTIQANFIGTNAAGTAALPNAIGVNVVGAANNSLGGGSAGSGNVISGNVISGNVGDGVQISGATATGNLVEGNFIGTNSAGTAAIPNDTGAAIGGGVDIAGASGNTIGGLTNTPGTGAGNLISGNADAAIFTQGSIGGNLIEGNLIGTDSTGTQPLGNGFLGAFGTLRIASPNNSIGGVAAGARNVISGGGRAGVQISAMGTIVQGNYIGTDITGTVAIGNHTNGVAIGGNIPAGPENILIGGTSAGARNVISGNLADGVNITGATDSGNTVQGNYIGVKATGTVALPNIGVGVDIASPGNLVGGNVAGAGNIISGNGTGVQFTSSSSTNNMLQGNYIGTTPTQISTVSDGLASTDGNAALGTGPGPVRYQQEAAASDFSGPVLIYSLSFRLDGAATAGVSGTWSDFNLQLSTTLQAAGGLSTTYASNVGADVKTVFSGPISFSYAAAGPSHAPNAFGGTVTFSTPFLYNPANGNLLIDISSSSGPNVSYSLDEQGLPGVWAVDGSDPNGTTASHTFAGVIVAQFVSTPVNLGNAGAGVIITSGSMSNTIGGATSSPGTGAGNVISGNAQNGILINGGGSNLVQGNLVGANAAGTAALANGSQGIYVSSASNTIGGGTAGAGNVISGNADVGLLLDTSAANGNLVQGNFIGTNAAGTAAVPNLGWSGVEIVSGSNNTIGGVTATPGTGAGNLVSGNAERGITIVFGPNNLIAGNIVGLNATGAGPLGNAYQGVEIGSDAGNSVGGTSAGLGNVISDNGGFYGGVFVSDSTGTLIAGNYIGTDITGTAAIGNIGDGIQLIGSSGNTIGGATAAARNVISGNGRDGIRIINALPDDLYFGTSPATGNLVEGNYVGTNAAGTAALANTGNGINLSASGNTIGGTAAGAGNVISGNIGNGVYVATVFQSVSSLAIADQLNAGTLPGTVATGTIAQADMADQTGPAIGDWPYNNPIPGGGGTNYAFLATGTLQVNAAGTFTFDTGSDDGSRLRIDGQDVAVAPNPQVFTDTFGTVTLSAGTHTIEWTGYQDGGGAGFELSVAAGSGVIGPVTTANGWHVLGDPNADPAISLQGSIAVTVSYSVAAGGQANVIQGNKIGTNTAGTLPLANGADGVLISNGASNNMIGGTATGVGNLIAFNGGQGVLVIGPSSTADLIQDNTYLSNSGNAIELDAGTQAFVGGTVAGNVLDNGVFDLDSINTSIGALTGSGVVTNTETPIAQGPATFTVGTNNGGAIFSGVIQNGTGVLALTKTGTGTEKLTGLSTYTGVTTISAGTLQVGNNNATASMGSGDAIDNASLVFLVSNNTVVANNISGSGSLAQKGVGAITLAGDNTYQGASTISAGATLQAGSASAFSPNSIFSNAGTLNLGGFSNSVGDLNGNGTVTNSLLNVYQIDNGAFANSSGIITDFNLSLTGEPDDNWVGNVFTAAEGATSLDSISFATGSPLNSSNLPSPFVTVALYLGSPGTGLTLINSSVNTVPLSALALQMITVPFAQPQNLPPGQVFTAAVLIDDVPSNVLPFIETAIGTNTNSYYDLANPSGIVNVYNLMTPNLPTLNGMNFPGTNSSPNEVNTTLLRVNASVANGTPPATFTVSGGGSFTGAIQDGVGALALNKTGANTLTLSGANTYTGGTTVAAGTLLVTGALGTGVVSIDSGATLDDEVIITNDMVLGSLRQAIVNADLASGPGLNEITFDLPGSGVQGFKFFSPLPAITSSVLLDGTSEPGYAGTPLIELDGIDSPLNAAGLTLVGPDITRAGFGHSSVRWGRHRRRRPITLSFSTITLASIPPVPYRCPTAILASMSLTAPPIISSAPTSFPATKAQASTFPTPERHKMWSRQTLLVRTAPVVMQERFLALSLGSKAKGTL